MADEANTTNPATAAPAAAAPQAPSLDSPPAAAPAVAPSDAGPAPAANDAAAAPAPAETAPAADTGGPEATLLEKFDSGAPVPDGEKAATEVEAAPEGDKKPPAESKADDAKTDDKAPEAKDAKPETKAEEKPEAKTEAKKEAEPAETPKLEPVPYEYALPDTLQLDDARKGEFHVALDGFRADPAKGAQGLVDLHNKAMTEYAQHLQDEQMRVWNETRKNWRTQVMADEELGGSGYQTAMGTVAKMRDLFVPAAERKAFDEFLSATGAGDHPAFLKMLHRAGRHFEEAKQPPSDIKPSPDNGRQTGRRGALLYDHPRSPQNRQQ